MAAGWRDLFALVHGWHSSSAAVPKFPGDTDWSQAGVGDAEVAAKAGEPGESDWSQAGVGSVGVAARES